MAAVAAAPPPTPGAAVVNAVIACRAVAEPGARLACFDKAAAAMDQAQTGGDIVVIDREQRRAARRQAFGLTLPSLSFLDRGERPADVDRLEARIAGARRGAQGRWTLVLEGGAVWVQTDEFDLPRDPHPGSTADIRKGVLGSYMMKIDGQQGIKVRRAS